MDTYVTKRKEVQVAIFQAIPKLAETDDKATKWHFEYDGLVFTHENDQCWIVGSKDGKTKLIGTSYFTQFDSLVKFADHYQIIKNDVLRETHMSKIFEGK